MTTTSTPHQARYQQQQAEYAFPYHWIPLGDERGWRIARDLAWGFEYLGILNSVRDVALRETGPGERVLDIGCGDGRLAHELLANGIAKVVGVDPVETAIGFAKAFVHEFGGRAEFHCGRVQDLEGRDFGVATAMEVLEHISDQELPAVIEAVHQRLAPGGRFIVSVPTINRPLQPKHERHYTHELLAQQLEPWFEVEGVSYLHRCCHRENWLRRLTINRFGVLGCGPILRLATRYYQRSILPATPEDGAHLLACCRRK